MPTVFPPKLTANFLIQETITKSVISNATRTIRNFLSLTTGNDCATGCAKRLKKRYAQEIIGSVTRSAAFCDLLVAVEKPELYRSDYFLLDAPIISRLSSGIEILKILNMIDR